MPETNVMVWTPWGDEEVDSFWPASSVVIETDGWGTHCDRETFRRDHAKAMALRATGYDVLRLTWEQVVHEERRTVAQLERVIPRIARPRGP